MSDAIARPPQVPTALSRAYWEGAARGRLLIQRCGACGKLRHYPRLLCDACHADAVDWVEASGRGSVHSWTVCHHAFHPSFRDELPYTLVTVDLEEGVRALGRWRGPAPAIGMPVRGAFVARAGGVDLVFAPVDN
ncbi:MAG: Zn-ribbon domain-containing OB-fold protein [Burkholderiales bacterium]|nr:Zn-ribbon domain-containing OB-fold protein [Burkholderiales bacterium]